MGKKTGIGIEGIEIQVVCLSATEMEVETRQFPKRITCFKKLFYARSKEKRVVLKILHRQKTMFLIVYLTNQF